MRDHGRNWSSCSISVIHGPMFGLTTCADSKEAFQGGLTSMSTEVSARCLGGVTHITVLQCTFALWKRQRCVFYVIHLNYKYCLRHSRPTQLSGADPSASLSALVTWPILLTADRKKY